MDVGVGVGGEVLQPLGAGEAGFLDTAGAAPFVAGVALGQQQFGEQGGVGVPATLGRRDRLTDPVADGGQVQGSAGSLDRGDRGLLAEPGPPR